MSLSVLEKPCSDESRPYSRKELEVLRKNLLRRLRIGTVYVTHQECNHGYYCKAGGKKEKEARESNGENAGNCSVCWKFNRTPKRLKASAKSLTDCYMNKHLSDFNPPKSYFHYELEADFYTWLYNEFNPNEEKVAK